jgi:MFS-type transporter involved in bile tolerance (Atg22 family)
MLSHAAAAVGTGWGFGLHEAMDQVGALAGPLLVASVLGLGGSYRTGLAVLLGPALAAMGLLALARSVYPRPQALEPAGGDGTRGPLPRRLRLYLAAVGLIAAGYADFPLIAYHFGKAAHVPASLIPVFYGVAMGVDALAALVFGKLYDRAGVRVLAMASVASSMAAPLAFSGSAGLRWAGMALWGAGMGAQESVMRAAVAEMTPPERRGSAYGVFNAAYGACWFAGSALMGVLYGVDARWLVRFSVLAQLAGAVLVWRCGRRQKA